MAGLFDDLIPAQRPRQGPPMLRPFKPGESVANSDGSHSTELTTTWQLPNGSWVNVPSLWMGATGPVKFDEGDEQGILSTLENYEMGGQMLPRFKTLPEAEAAAQARSNAGGAASGGLFDDLIPTAPEAPAAPAYQSPTLEDFASGTGAFGADPGPATAPLAPEPGIADRFGRALQVNMQGVGRGLAGFFGAPFDLTGALLDLGLSGAELATNKALIPAAEAVAGDFVEGDVELPRLGQMPMGKQHLTDSASNIMRAVGIEPIEKQDLAPMERLHSNVLEFGTEAGAAGSTLSNIAQQRFPNQTMSGVTPSAGDALLRPYVGGSGAPVALDVASGMGSGVGATAAEQYFPDSDIAKLLLMMAGGIGGASIVDAARGAKNAFDTATGFMTDPNIPYSPGGAAPTSRRVVEHTRNFLEDTLTDPQAARDRVARRIDEAHRNNEPLPTTGVASDDIGMVALERGLRNKREMQPKFEVADQKLKDAAQDRIANVKDVGADQSKAMEFAGQRQQDLQADRDAAALPLLRQAEQSGAAIDAKPVADLIDGMLAKDKRPAVVSALKQARSMLNAAGTDNLDTSVSGLYETRKAINDIIDGRTDTPTGRYATRELVQVRDALDKQITSVVPEFGQYLTTYRAQSRPLDLFKESNPVKRLVDAPNGDVRNVARELLGGSEYGSEKAFREINQAIAANPDAKRGWRAAVAEVLADKVTNTNTALSKTDDGPLSIAKMQKVFRLHEDGLAQIFSPDEMNTIRRAHKMLEPLGNLSRQSTVGSPTSTNQQLVNAFEAGVLAYTGNAIQTGMIMKRIKVAMNLLPGVQNMTLESKMQDFVKRLMFDPELFVHVMDTPVKRMEAPEWNAKLNRLLAISEAAGSREDQNSPQ